MGTNHFLKTLSPQAFSLIEPHLRRREFPLRHYFYRAGEQIPFVYFPFSGVVSFVVGLEDGGFIEAGLIGPNGVMGAGAVLDSRTAINFAISQIAGHGVTIGVPELQAAVDVNPEIRRLLASHDQALLAHAQQTAACNAAHTLEERLCRWLHLCRDVTNNDTLPLTQEFLAQMLGVNRSSLTMTALRLQQTGLIAYRRGKIDVKDHLGLQDGACECYGAVNTHLGRLTGWRPPLSNGSDTSNETEG